MSAPGVDSPLQLRRRTCFACTSVMLPASALRVGRPLVSPSEAYPTTLGFPPTTALFHSPSLARTDGPTRTERVSVKHRPQTVEQCWPKRAMHQRTCALSPTCVRLRLYDECTQTR